MKKYIIILLLLFSMVYSQEDNSEKVKKQVKTVYDINGRPINQSQNSKGIHTVKGVVTLSSGTATITLNTSTENGKQDISFLADSTYSGSAWTLNSSDTAIYRVRPISGTQFIISVIKPSDFSSTATVRYQVQGE